MKKTMQSSSHQRKRPIYEDIRWRFTIQLATLALVALLAAEMFMYDDLAKSFSDNDLETGETVLSMFVLFDLLLVIRYVPDKVDFLKKNWLKALMVLPNWVMIKPFAIIGFDNIIPHILSQNGITQAGRGLNVWDSAKDVLDKL